MYNDHCSICDCDVEENVVDEIATQSVRKDQEETSFAVLLALVPAMTMTLFNLMGLI